MGTDKVDYVTASAWSGREKRVGTDKVDYVTVSAWSGREKKVGTDYLPGEDDQQCVCWGEGEGRAEPVLELATCQFFLLY